MTTDTARATKKARILEAFDGGEQDIDKLATLVDSTPSYVAQVIQARRGHDDLPGYYDLYTSTARSMNVYASRFRGKMRFKDEPSARRSVRVIDRAYRSFEEERDRAGQHHAMALALTMMNRAWASGKLEEAAHFARWFESRIAPLTRRHDPTAPANNDVEQPAHDPREDEHAS